ncbi:TPA: hypothetical protein ACH3X2_005834 [Trebouxia sp. C0005]
MQGLDRLHSTTAAQPQKQLHPLAELEDGHALTSMESEQKAAAAPATAPASASAPAPAHDSVPAPHTDSGGRMWDMVADNPEMQQHMVSQLDRAEEDLARSQASHQNRSAHRVATLSRVQDTRSNSIARKGVLWLDAGQPKSKRSKTAQQPEAGQAGPSAEAEAEPFSKPEEQVWDQDGRSRLQQLRLLTRRTAQQQTMLCQVPSRRLHRSSPGCPSLHSSKSASGADVAKPRT